MVRKQEVHLTQLPVRYTLTLLVPGHTTLARLLPTPSRRPIDLAARPHQPNPRTQQCQPLVQDQRSRRQVALHPAQQEQPVAPGDRGDEEEGTAASAPDLCTRFRLIPSRHFPSTDLWNV